MNIDREKILSELESHISRSLQVMRQAATADHKKLHTEAEMWLESMETDLRVLRQLFEEYGLTEQQGDGS
ncbi:MAG: hypothetical protein WBO34_08375 [Gammaproteobacteria bacterium]